MTPPIIGIDLGTTYSLVAVLEADRPVVLPNALGELLTPSAVSLLEDGSLVVGAAAAGAIAGLRVDRIVNEPTAAALAYGLHERRELRAIVLDLGGGTFDVTLIELVDGVIEVQGTAGDTHLGGDDFDRALAEHLAKRVEQERGLRLAEGGLTRARLSDAAERAKRRLSSLPRTTLALPEVETAAGRVVSLELECTQVEAEQAWSDLLERIRRPIARALSDASLTPSDVDEVLLVGGSTRMPCIARLAAQIFGRLPLRSLPPDEAVGMGAAVQAALKQGAAAVEDLVVTDVAPFSMGVATASEFGAQWVAGIFTPVLERGTVIPASRERRFFTTTDRQRRIRVEVYQGERSLCSENLSVGTLMLEGLPARPAGEVAVDIRFTYDLNGILEVEAGVVGTDERQARVFERSTRRLSAEQIRAAREAMKRLKIHSRDALPNTTALARADALFVELVGDERERLGHAIAMFRSALESDDARAYEPVRAALIALTSALRR